MPTACYVCRNSKAFHRFPKDEARLRVWMEHLCLGTEPPEHARVCSEHFNSSDIYVSGGRRFLYSEAVPSRSVKCKSYLHDHNYGLGMVYEEESFPPEIFVFTLFGLFLLFDFFLSTSPSQSSSTNHQGKYFDIINILK